MVAIVVVVDIVVVVAIAVVDIVVVGVDKCAVTVVPGNSVVVVVVDVVSQGHWSIILFLKLSKCFTLALYSSSLLSFIISITVNMCSLLSRHACSGKGCGGARFCCSGLYRIEKPEPGANSDENRNIANMKNILTSFEDRSLKYRI